MYTNISLQFFKKIIWFLLGMGPSWPSAKLYVDFGVYFFGLEHRLFTFWFWISCSNVCPPSRPILFRIPTLFQKIYRFLLLAETRMTILFWCEKIVTNNVNRKSAVTDSFACPTKIPTTVNLPPSSIDVYPQQTEFSFYSDEYIFSRYKI